MFRIVDSLAIAARLLIQVLFIAYCIHNHILNRLLSQKYCEKDKEAKTNQQESILGSCF